MRDWFAEYGLVLGFVLALCLWIVIVYIARDEIWIRDCAEHRPLVDCIADRATMTGKTLMEDK